MKAPLNRRHKQIGLDRILRLEWLERTAYLILAGNDNASVKTLLRKEISGWFRSINPHVRGSIDKTLTILLRIWGNAPPELTAFHQEALSLFSESPREKHIVIHWGMTMAVYPFWGAVAAHTGRLLTLQGGVLANQVQRRLREQYGERETVSRRVRYVLRSFIDWNVLRETSQKGVYKPGISICLEDPKRIAWLLEASLHARPNGSAAIKELLGSPSSFPFSLDPISAEQAAALSPRLYVLRHGLDDDLLLLGCGEDGNSK